MDDNIPYVQVMVLVYSIIFTVKIMIIPDYMLFIWDTL